VVAVVPVAIGRRVRVVRKDQRQIAGTTDKRGARDVREIARVIRSHGLRVARGRDGFNGRCEDGIDAHFGMSNILVRERGAAISGNRSLSRAVRNPMV
jgi:hypothetical protein